VTVPYLIQRLLERYSLPFGGLRGLDEQLQLRIGFDQPAGRHRHRAHRDPPRHRERERALCGVPELQIER